MFLITIFLKQKRDTVVSEKKATTHKSRCSLHHWPFVLLWSKMLSSPLLCTTTTSQLQSGDFRSIKSNKITRIKFSSFERKKKHCLAKQIFSNDKILPCPRIKLAISQPLIWDGEEKRVLLSDFARGRLPRKP